MQLGTRWPAGTIPPRAVPEVLHAQIAAVEGLIDERRRAAADAVVDADVPRGPPVAELDTGVIVTTDASARWSCATTRTTSSPEPGC